MSVELGDFPSIKLVLSLLQQKQVRDDSVDTLTDWLIAHTASGGLKGDLVSSAEMSLAITVFNTVSKLFLDEIQTICSVANPEQDAVPLTRYLTGGRGLMLLSALSKSAGPHPAYSGELSALLLSLATFLKPDMEQQVATECQFLPPISCPQFNCLTLSPSLSKTRSIRNVARAGKTGRRRAGRPGGGSSAGFAGLSGFPEVTGQGLGDGQVVGGENLAEWEGSPSSETGEVGENTSLVKYIPVNYFAYYDNANLDSDEVTGEASNSLPRPPPLPGPPPLSTPRQVALLALDLVCRLTRHTGQTVPPQEQATMIQLAMVATSQIKVSHKFTLRRIIFIIQNKKL